MSFPGLTPIPPANALQLCAVNIPSSNNLLELDVAVTYRAANATPTLWEVQTQVYVDNLTALALSPNAGQPLEQYEYVGDVISTTQRIHGLYKANGAGPLTFNVITFTPKTTITTGGGPYCRITVKELGISTLSN